MDVHQWQVHRDVGPGWVSRFSTYMLHGVSHARHTVFVAEISHSDIDCGTSLVRLGIVDQQDFQIVLKADDAVVAIINRRLLEGIGQEHDRRMTAGLQGRGLRRLHASVSIATSLEDRNDGRCRGRGKGKVLAGGR